MSKRIKTTATLFVVLFSLSSLFAQYGADKYGSKGAIRGPIQAVAARIRMRPSPNIPKRLCR